MPLKKRIKLLFILQDKSKALISDILDSENDRGRMIFYWAVFHLCSDSYPNIMTTIKKGKFPVSLSLEEKVNRVYHSNVLKFSYYREVICNASSPDGLPEGGEVRSVTIYLSIQWFLKFPAV